MHDELDYRIEAACQQQFASRYAGHPFIRVPHVVPQLSSRRVLTSEWVDGMKWDDFLDHASPEIRQRAAEVLFRFAQGSIHRNGVFNGDPHPGNYRFHKDGSVTFLDFGLVKRWSPGELEQLSPVLDALLQHDEIGTIDAMVRAGFLKPDHGHDPLKVWEYVSGPYVPYLSDTFMFTREWTGQQLGRLVDISGPYSEIIRSLNMPTSFVILDRVVWGMSALLGRMNATNRWRAILAEYRENAPPETELGRIEAEWRDKRRASL
jgi:serine/threonine protein kinase